MNGNIYDNEYKLGSNYEEENVLMDTRMCSNECSENIRNYYWEYYTVTRSNVNRVKKIGNLFFLLVSYTHTQWVWTHDPALHSHLWKEEDLFEPRIIGLNNQELIKEMMHVYKRSLP